MYIEQEYERHSQSHKQKHHRQIQSQRNLLAVYTFQCTDRRFRKRDKIHLKIGCLWVRRVLLSITFCNSANEESKTKKKMRVRKHGKIPMLAWNKDFKPLQKIKGIVVINIAMHTYRIAVAGIAAVTVTVTGVFFLCSYFEMLTKTSRQETTKCVEFKWNTGEKYAKFCDVELLSHSLPHLPPFAALLYQYFSSFIQFYINFLFLRKKC